MRIDQHNVVSHRQQAHEAQRGDLRRPAKTAEPAQLGTSRPGATVETTPAPPRPDGAETHRIIQKLDAGHFKGVAELRHRLRFFDELSSRAHVRAAEEAPQAVASLIEGLQTHVDAAIAGLSLQEDQATQAAALREVLMTTMAAAGAQQAQGGALDIDALSGSLQAAFDSFIVSLSALGAGPANPIADPGIDPTQGDRIDALNEGVRPGASRVEEPTDPARDPVNHLTPDASAVSSEPVQPEAPDALGELGEAFAAALQSMQQALSAAGSLPDPSPAPGNGRAYQKFLAMYDALRYGPNGSSLNAVA